MPMIKQLLAVVKELEAEASDLRRVARNSYDMCNRMECYSEAEGIDTAILKLRKLIGEYHHETSSSN